MKTKLAVSLAMAGIAGCSGLEQAPDFPIKPVTVVVPYPVGNAADMVARIMTENLAKTWGQSVVVENRAGATTVPGVDAVAKANPDGYTVLAHSVSFATDAGLYSGLPYDPSKDFTPVAGIAKQPFALVTSPASGAKSVAQLIELAKKKPLRYGSLGTTTQIYFVTEQFRRQAGIEASNVSFKSLIEANGALIKGEVAFWFPPVAGAAQGVRDGKLVALAVTADKRSAMLPDVPTLAEAGVAGVVSYAWFGVWVPSRVAAGVVEKLAADITRVRASPDVRAAFAKLGAEPLDLSRADFGRFVADETQASQRLIRSLGIKPQVYSALR